MYKAIFVSFVFLRVFAVPSAQDAGKTVADGVYTEEQAARGATAYETACAGCHRNDLGGGTGPALKAQRFARQFADKDLRALFAKIATTMPRATPGSLGDATYLDIVAHLLKENGFPAGPKELAADGLDGVRVLAGRPKPPPPVGDFSYVEVVGCLTADAQHTWRLTRASAPVSSAVPTAATAARTTDGHLGRETYRLLDAIAYAPEAHNGEKVYVRGLLIRLPEEQRITISALETLSPSCTE
ncbi:MAG TPA: cytochrome c [Vicinamibacterales bacterium]|nr:cytochrome c [Vicinamibacterales bacterium]